jgi:hypothetical protein
VRLVERWRVEEEKGHSVLKAVEGLKGKEVSLICL